MKSNADFVVDLNCTKQELIDYLKKNKGNDNYVRVSEHDDYDVCLELTWMQHGGPYVDYLYLANVIGNQLVGRIVLPKKSEQKDKKDKWSCKDIFELLKIILFGLLFFYGMPFAIIYAISERLLLSIGLGTVPLLIIIISVSFESNHIKTHKANIEEFIKRCK